jgi:hypothetical protein
VGYNNRSQLTINSRFLTPTRSLFFTAIFPQGLFVTAFAFFVSYWVDKYCLFRLWKQPPAMDGALATAARFQISLIFIFNCFVSQHFLRGWPFDNLQETDTAPTGAVSVDGAVVSSPTIYKSVEQASYNFFDWTKQDWFTDDQTTVVKIYSIVNIVALSVFGAWYFGHTCHYGIHKLFWGSYVSVGDAKEVSVAWRAMSHAGALTSTYILIVFSNSLTQRALTLFTIVGRV